MLNCDQVTNLCSAELERRLSAWERLSLKMHLLMCRGCSNYRVQMGTIHAAMHQYADGRAVTDKPNAR
jgi:hypothetical protein